MKKYAVRKNGGNKLNICIVNCFDTYEQRVDLLTETLKGYGHNVVVLASDYRHIDKCKRTEAKEGYIFFNAQPYKKNLSIKRMKSHMSLSKKISDYIEKKIDSFDLIYALIPPNSVVKDLCLLKREHPEIIIIFDLIDLWPETMPVGKMKNMPPFTYWRNLRDKHLNAADLVVTECELYRKKLSCVLKDIKTVTLYLARKYDEYIPALHLPDEKISLCYLGSINNIIDINAIESVVRRFQKIKPIELHIIGDGENRENLISRMKSIGADVIYHGKIYDRKEKQYIFDGCHFGLNIMKSSVCVGLTMKSIDYFEFGLPIINNIKGDTWDIVESANIGFNWDEGADMKIFSEYPLHWRKEVRLYFENNLTNTAFKKNISDILLFIERKHGEC